MTIRVLSFDFDGCLFNMGYIESFPKDIIQANAEFLAGIKEENKKFTVVQTFIGSNRQSFAIDEGNTTFQKPSCFPAVQEVTDHLGATLDPFLLADVYGDLPDGTSYQNAMKELKAQQERGFSWGRALEIEHSEWAFDNTKATILYAQIHKMASMYPLEDIVFDFYDDRGDIHEALSAFYKTHHELIPVNVTLRLHQYSGTTVTPIAEIKGTGFIDANYRQTIKDMAEADREKSHQTESYSFSYSATNEINVARTLRTDCQLANRKPLIMSRELSFKLSNIIREEAMSYLGSQANPNTTEELSNFTRLIAQAKKEGVVVLWDRIKDRVAERMFDECDEHYDDRTDVAFRALLNSGKSTKLGDLSVFQKQIQDSRGYHQYCTAALHQSGMFCATVKSADVPHLNSVAAIPSLS